MKSANLYAYMCVERKTFVKESFKSERNSLYLIEKGIFEYTVNGKKYTARENECVFYKKGSLYERTILSPVILHIFDIDINFTDTDAPISFNNQCRILSNIQMLSYANTDTTINLRYIEHLMNDIIETYFYEKSKGLVEPKSDERISTALKIMKNRFDKGITVEYVAKKTHLSYPQFVRSFKKVMNITPKEYINQLKLEKAKALLYTTNLSIEAIALECGFNDTFYFSNFFKKLTGRSPSDYRKIFLSNTNNSTSVFNNQ